MEGDKLYEMSPPRDVTLFVVELDPQFVFANQYLHIFNPSDTDYDRPADVILYVRKDGRQSFDEAA